MVRAALLHDIGKRHARLAPVARSIVTAIAKLGLPVGRRGALYLAHGRLAADELSPSGPSHWWWSSRPPITTSGPTINPEDWTTLVGADR